MMRIFLFTSLFLLSFLASFSQNITGNWQGNLEINGQQIPITFHFYKDSLGKWNGKWDSPSQNAMNLPCSEVTTNSDSLFIGIKMISGFYSGKFITPDSIAVKK